MDYRNKDLVKNKVVPVHSTHPIKEWKEVKDVITPGGTPMYICPICKSEESKHMYGLEFMKNKKNRCSHCGNYLKYPREKR